MRTGFIAMRLGVAVYIVPFLFVYMPELLLIGSTFDIIITTIAAFIGLALVSWGISKNFIRKMGILESLLLTMAGILILTAHTYTTIVGGLLAAAIIIIQIRSKKKLNLESVEIA